MASCTTIPISSPHHANDLSQRMINSPTLPLQKRGHLGLKRGPGIVAYYGLRKPPYDLDALEPYMSKKTLECHWGEYHRGHLEALNKHLSRNDVLYGYTMDELVKVAYNYGNPFAEFNDAAQKFGACQQQPACLEVLYHMCPLFAVWNHDFFWESMQPGGGDSPQLGLLKQIEKDFGSFTDFREKFIEEASTLFGSGWVWLVLKRKEKRLEVVKTLNAVTPIVWDDIPLLCLDMWEHAYCLDYQDDKATYATVFMDHLVSWHVATLRILRAQAFVNLGEPKIPVA